MWKIEEYPEFYSFTTSSGFRFEFTDVGEILIALEKLINKQPITNTRNNERFQIEWHGIVKVISCDPWVNKDFKMGDIVCAREEFIDTLIKFFKEHYVRFTNSNSKL